MIDYSYFKLIDDILTNGIKKDNRTGIKAYTIPGCMIKHDLRNGFPLLTTKKVYFKGIKVELEFFIKGISDKKWLQDRGCHIWDEWAAPYKIPYSNDEFTKQKMMEESDLGPVYGVMWNNFGNPVIEDGNFKIINGVNQLKNIVDTLKTNPNDRRMICSAWNPQAIKYQALPPCHFVFNICVIENIVNLSFNMRSWDIGLGAPYNIASYALLLQLLVDETNKYRTMYNKEPFIAGEVIAFGTDVHVYENHVESLKKQMKRTPYDLPKIETENFTTIFDWQYKDTRLIDYKSHDAIKMDVAV
jgi:thymidylate synthase